MKPLFLLDVDGPLNPYLAANKSLPYPAWRKAGLASGYAQARVRLNREHGPMLWRFAERMGMELAWATMWGPDAANRYIGSEIRLPELDGVDFTSLDPEFVAEHGQAWKFGYVAQWAGERPLAWVDDEFTLEHKFASEFLTDRAGALRPTLLVEISPKIGLVEADLKAVEAWMTGSMRPTVFENVRSSGIDVPAHLRPAV